MRWSELKVGDVVHLGKRASYLLLKVGERNVYLCLDTGEVSDTGQPDPDAAMHREWRVE